MLQGKAHLSLHLSNILIVGNHMSQRIRVCDERMCLNALTYLLAAHACLNNEFTNLR